MNELLELSKILSDEYAVNRSKWEILRAERIEHCENEPEGWVLTVRKIKTDDEGAANESNE